MLHMINSMAFSATMISENSSTKTQRLVQYLSLFLVFCFITLNSFAQPKGSLPDPGNTYGEGSRVRTTQSTDPDSFIPETKTEYFDGNGVLREEVTHTRDLDGNTVTNTNRYNKSGRLENYHEIRKDGNNNTVLEEDIYYDDMGKIKNANKRILHEGKWFYFSFDKIRQVYNEGKTYGYVRPETPKDKFVGNCSNTEIKFGYSYMVTGNSGITGTLPAGAEISIGRKLGNHMNLILDASGHQNKQGFQTLSRLSFQTGIQYNIDACDEDDMVSFHGRIAIGITLENIKFKVNSSSATAMSGTAGVGTNVKIFRKTSLYINADWVPSYFNKTLQHNFQAGAGLAFKF